MPNDVIKHVEVNGTTYDIVDAVSGYTKNTGTVTGVTAGTGLNTTSNDTATDGGTISTSGTLYLTKSGVTAGTYQGITVDKYGRVTGASDQGYVTSSGVTSVTASGALSSSGGTTPAITHNTPTTSPATSGDAAVYPIKIDSYGHIIEKGSSVTIPSVTSTYSSTGTTAVNGTAVNAALQTLDSSISATSGQAISAITITDGKIASSTKINVGDANQNAFSNIKIGSSTIAADSTTDTLELVAGTGITLTADTTNDKVTITSTVIGGVSDVQVNGTSVVDSENVANISVTNLSITANATNRTLFINTNLVDGDAVDY